MSALVYNRVTYHAPACCLRSQLQERLDVVAAQATESSVLLFSVLGKTEEARALKAITENEEAD